MVEIAKILKLDDNVDRYKTLLNKGKEAYERKLWNGMFRHFLLQNRFIISGLLFLYLFYLDVNSVFVSSKLHE